jgi:hypothetical protein
MRSHMKVMLARHASYDGPPDVAAGLISAMNSPSDDFQKNLYMSSLAERWALTDSKAALAWAAAEKDQEKRSKALETVAGVMMQKAHTWAEVGAIAAAMPDDDSREAAVSRGAANLPPVEVAAHLHEVTGSRFLALRQAITGDPPLPLDQVLSLVPEYAADEDADLTGVSKRLLEDRGPEAALAWTASLPEETRDKTMEALYRSWAASDPAAALAAPLQTSDPELRRRSMDYALQTWINEDPSAASEWLSKQPAGPLRDAGAERVAQSIALTDPSTALAWVATIADEKARSAALTAFPSYHSNTEIPDSWRASVEASTLSEEEKKRLLKPR